MEVRILAVPPGFEVRVERAAPGTSAGHDPAIDKLWEREQARHDGALADSTLLACVHADPQRLIGRFVRARDALAARRAPELFGGTPPALVHARALLTTRGRVVLGRRAEHLAHWPGRWDLVPVAALGARFHDPHEARIDPVAHVLAALEESLPLTRPGHEAATPFALAFDAREQTWSVCTAIELALDDDEVRRLEASSTPTHDAFRVVRPVDVLEAGLWDGDELVPLAAALVRLPRASVRAA